MHRECGYDNAPATVLREETAKVDRGSNLASRRGGLVDRVAACARCILLPERTTTTTKTMVTLQRTHTGTFIHADNRFWQGTRYRRRRRRAFFLAIPHSPSCETRAALRADAIVTTHGGNLLESPIVPPNCRRRRIEPRAPARHGRFYCCDFFVARREFSGRLCRAALRTSRARSKPREIAVPRAEFIRAMARDNCGRSTTETERRSFADNANVRYENVTSVTSAR